MWKIIANITLFEYFVINKCYNILVNKNVKNVWAKIEGNIKWKWCQSWPWNYYGIQVFKRTLFVWQYTKWSQSFSLLFCKALYFICHIVKKQPILSLAFSGSKISWILPKWIGQSCNGPVWSRDLEIQRCPWRNKKGQP